MRKPREISTERYDRDGKFEAYKRMPSFEEYVLVSQSERRIEIRRRVALRDDRWSTAVALAGDKVRIHGRDIEVDSIYA
jgi:Uma2 family endonuclease